MPFETEKRVRRADGWVWRTVRRVREARFGPVHRPVTIEGSEMGAGGSVESFVSRNQTDEGSAGIRNDIASGCRTQIFAFRTLVSGFDRHGSTLINPISRVAEPGIEATERT